MIPKEAKSQATEAWSSSWLKAGCVDTSIPGLYTSPQPLILTASQHKLKVHPPTILGIDPLAYKALSTTRIPGRAMH